MLLDFIVIRSVLVFQLRLLESLTTKYFETFRPVTSHERSSETDRTHKVHFAV